jgi:ATP-dependent Lon protease
MLFENSDSDEDKNVNICITKRNNKRKRTPEKYDGSSMELDVLYNLYNFISNVVKDSHLSVIKFNKFLDEFIGELTNINKNKKSTGRLMEDVINKIGYRHRSSKRSRNKYHETMNNIIEICKNGVIELKKETTKERYNIYGIQRCLKNKIDAIKNIYEDNNVVESDCKEESEESEEESDEESDEESTEESEEELDDLSNEESLSKEDKNFLEYLYNKQNKGSKKDYNYFKTLDKKEKTELLDLLQTIKIKNNVHKPYLFRALQSKLPLEVKAEVIRKVEMSEGDGSAEDNHKLTTWIEALLKVPFGNLKNNKISNTHNKKYITQHFRNALKTMDTAIYGHNHAKNAILQIIAQNFSNPNGQSIVLGIQGPMGNGKTTLVEKGVAKVLDRPFVHISLGGAKDSSYLEGHDYTYIGSKWGKVVDLLMKSKAMNPIIYFDELDKVSQSEKGDEIINVLMHLIDTSQNNHFEDKYFTGIEFDLSNATFIFSYNDSSLVSPILMDRITEIETTGFKTQEKIEIATKYLQPSIMKDIGFKNNDLQYEDNVYQHIIENYTEEGGVRKLKEILYQVAREINLRKLINTKINNKKLSLPLKVTKTILDTDILKEYNTVNHTKIATQSSVGKICGMYATANHTGGITIVEVQSIPTKQKLALELTGSQGKVMKESMSVAKTVAWNIIPVSYKIALQKEWKDGNTGFHIHCPDGSTEKDGPSAGLAITTALVSSITKIKIKKDIAVTGEIDLDGSALAIGGLVHKLYGAKRAGVTLALCPVENKNNIEKIKKDYDDLIDDNFKVIMVNNILEVLKYALEDNNIEFINYYGMNKEHDSKSKKSLRKKKY